MNYKRFYAEGYFVIERNETETHVQINGGKCDVEGITSILEWVNQPAINTSVIDTEYYDSEPLYDLYKDGKLIENMLNDKELDNYVKSL